MFIAGHFYLGSSLIELDKIDESIKHLQTAFELAKKECIQSDCRRRLIYISLFRAFISAKHRFYFYYSYIYILPRHMKSHCTQQISHYMLHVVLETWFLLHGTWNMTNDACMTHKALNQSCVLKMDLTGSGSLSDIKVNQIHPDFGQCI